MTNRIILSIKQFIYFILNRDTSYTFEILLLLLWVWRWFIVLIGSMDRSNTVLYTIYSFMPNYSTYFALITTIMFLHVQSVLTKRILLRQIVSLLNMSLYLYLLVISFNNDLSSSATGTLAVLTIVNMITFLKITDIRHA